MIRTRFYLQMALDLSPWGWPDLTMPFQAPSKQWLRARKRIRKPRTNPRAIPYWFSGHFSEDPNQLVLDLKAE